MLNTLTKAEKTMLEGYVEDTLTPNSHAVLEVSKRVWKEWADNTGKTVFPARPDDVALWCVHLHKELRRAPKTIQTRLWALGYWHTDKGLNDPTKQGIVRRVMRTINRKGVIVAGQAPPLRGSDLRNIIRCLDTSKRINVRDIAMVCTMRDALLRVNEVRTIEWKHITQQDDGLGCLHLPHIKTQHEAEGITRLLSEHTMGWLHELQSMTEAPIPDGTLMFGMTTNNGVADRLRRMSCQANMPHFTATSILVGASQDLADGGASHIDIMRAARWKSATPIARHVQPRMVHPVGLESSEPSTV